MATNIEILDNYEKNGKTYTGSFPLFVSTVVCETFFLEEGPQQNLGEDDDPAPEPPTPEPPTPEPTTQSFALFSVGQGTVGQLGTGNSNQNIFGYKEVFFTPLTGSWNALAVGGQHVLALSAGELYATGTNFVGQLGLGDVNLVTTFTKVTGDWTKLDKLICGGNNSFVREENTNIWYACGSNDQYQLGLENNQPTRTFTRVPSEWETVQATGNRTLLKGLDGYWYGCGGNFGGLLGVRRWITPPETPLLTDPPAVADQKCTGTQADVSPVTSPTKVTNLRRNPTCIGNVCPRFTVPKKFDFMYQRAPTAGITLAWGYRKTYLCEPEEYEKIYHKTTNNDPEREFGDLWNQLPAGVLPVKIVSGNTAAGHIVIWADNNKLYGQGLSEYFGMGSGVISLAEITTLPAGEIIDVAASLRGTYVIIKNPITQINQLFVTGFNEFGELGLGDQSPRTFFQPASTGFSTALEGDITAVFSDGASNFVYAASGLSVGEG